VISNWAKLVPGATINLYTLLSPENIYVVNILDVGFIPSHIYVMDVEVRC